jgi:hypothetical protein
VRAGHDGSPDALAIRSARGTKSSRDHCVSGLGGERHDALIRVGKSQEIIMNSRFLALALFALAATPALADEAFKPTAAQRDACLRKYCKNVHPPKGADDMTVQTMYQACLNEHRDNARPDHLSQKCLDLFTQYGR